MAVRALDAYSLSDGVMEALYEVIARCHTEENAEEPSRTRAEVEAFLRHSPDADPRGYWIAESAGECVGFAQLSLMRGSSTGQIEVLVHPDRRRRGYGSALLEAVRERALARGAARLAGSHATEGGSHFAAAVGAGERHREVRSLLRLPLGEGPTSRPVDGYSLRSWVGEAPSELLDSYARARNAINDAPHGFEERQIWTPALVRDLETTVARRDRDVRDTVALDRKSEVVAFTELRVSRTLGAIAGTEDTAVVAEHRRRGLARWVKLQSLRLLERDRPDVSLVGTTNAEDNHAMLALNRALGFSPVAVYTSSVLDL